MPIDNTKQILVGSPVKIIKKPSEEWSDDILSVKGLILSDRVIDNKHRWLGIKPIFDKTHTTYDGNSIPDTMLLFIPENCIELDSSQELLDAILKFQAFYQKTIKTAEELQVKYEALIESQASKHGIQKDSLKSILQELATFIKSNNPYLH